MKILAKSNVKRILRIIYCTRENPNVPYRFRDAYTNYLLPINRLSIEHVVPKCYLPKINVWDLNNLLLVDKQLNNFRSISKFDTCNRRNKSFCPPYGESKGVVARVCAHMLYTYPTIDSKLVIDKEVLLEWNERYPVTDIEKYRNEKIYYYQGTYNEFIDKDVLKFVEK